MVPGVALLPATALGGYIGYKIWPYLSKSTRDIPKNVALDTAGFFMDGDFWGGIITGTGAIFLVGLSYYTVKVLWTGESGFWPTLAKLVATEALILAGSLGIGVLVDELDNQGYFRRISGEDAAVISAISANFVFIPIAASRLALESTDNRETATVAGIMGLATVPIILGLLVLAREYIWN